MSFSKKYIDNVKKNTITYFNNNTVNEIVKFLLYCDNAYRNTDTEIIDDLTYDLLYDELKKKDPDNYFFSIIEYSVDKKNKVDLPYPMGSLDKIKPNDNKIKNWTKKYIGDYVISEKLDGISSQLYKSDNKSTLYTRGDGLKGLNITHILRYLIKKDILDKLPNDISIRGEIILEKKDFKKLEKDYKNARSAISGLASSDVSSFDENVAKNAKFVVYDILNYDHMNHLEKLKFLEKANLNLVWYKKISLENFEDNLINNLKERKSNSPFNIDGIVCHDISKTYKHKEGNPKHAIAFKMNLDNQIKETKVIDVIWDPSMYGYLQPTVIIEPIEIEGSTISRATGHNAKFIKDNSIGVGSIIKIIKSGDVIPYILDVVKKTKIKWPNIKYKWNETEIEIIVDKPNKETKDIIENKKIVHFFKTIKVKNFSDGIIKKLYDNGYNSITKIIDADREKLENIDGIGKKMVKKIYEDMKKCLKNMKLNVLMAASLKFDRGFGVRRLKLITDNIPNILNNNLKKETIYNNIIEIDGFSEITTNQFIKNLESFKKFFNELEKVIDIKNLKHSNVKILKKNNENKKFSGKKFVFSGFRDNDLTEKIINLGGEVTSTVSKNTHMLIVKDISEISSKITKAEENNIKIVEKEQFIKNYL